MTPVIFPTIEQAPLSPLLKLNIVPVGGAEPHAKFVIAAGGAAVGAEAGATTTS